jgi:putative mRNA 3-end processing factor
MLDCGLKIRDTEGLPTLPEHTDALILSHAHLDHSGMAPALYKKDRPRIYGTDLTFETAHILQNDSAKVKQLRNETDLYSTGDITAMQQYEVAVGYDTERTIAADMSFTFMDAGHIPGSASVLLEIEGKKVFYTGDIKTVDTYLQRGADVPQADILITESTYGNRVHPDRKTMEAEFLAAVEETIDAGGNVIIPAFAVGRTQEALIMLRKISAPLYLDGMGQKVTSLFLQYSEYLRDANLLKKSANAADWINGNGDRQRAMSEPSVIVTTAGMVNGGPVMQYLNRLHMDKSSSILLTGYQVEGTNGRLLMEKGYVKDPFTNKELQVLMQKKQFDFSAHAGRHSLEKIAKKVSPEKAFVVHGDPEPAKAFSEFLSSICETHAPKIGETFEL